MVTTNVSSNANIPAQLTSDVPVTPNKLVIYSSTVIKCLKFVVIILGICITAKSLRRLNPDLGNGLIIGTVMTIFIRILFLLPQGKGGESSSYSSTDHSYSGWSSGGSDSDDDMDYFSD